MGWLANRVCYLRGVAHRHWSIDTFGVASRHDPGPVSRGAELGAQLGQWRTCRWLRDVDAATRAPAGGQVQRRVTLQDAPDLYARGATICADVSAAPSVVDALDAMRRTLARPGRGFAKLYASPPGAGFAMHLDGDHVIVAQLVGRKRWWYGARPALPGALHPAKADAQGRAVWAAPREGLVRNDDGTPLQVPDRDALQTCVLAPGDRLYLPPGTWHATEAERHSVAVSFSPPRAPVLRWVLDAAAAAAQSRAEGRADLGVPPPADLTGNLTSLGGDDVRACIAALRAGLDALDPRTVQRAWLAALRRAAPSDPTLEGAQHSPEAIESRPIDASTRLRVADPQGIPFVVGPQPHAPGDAVFVYAADAEWVLPPDAAPFVDALARAGEFTLAQARGFDAALAEEDVVDLLQQLLEGGLLARDG